MIVLFLFLRPSLLKFLVMAGLIAAALTFHFLTLSPFEGSVREGPVSAGTKFARTVGRRLAYTGIYRDIVRRSSFYFQPADPIYPNPSAGARFLKKHLPQIPWKWPGKFLGFSLGAVYFYLIACTTVALFRR
jgi:hypothetical protein